MVACDVRIGVRVISWVSGSGGGGDGAEVAPTISTASSSSSGIPSRRAFSSEERVLRRVARRSSGCAVAGAASFFLRESRSSFLGGGACACDFSSSFAGVEVMLIFRFAGRRGKSFGDSSCDVASFLLLRNDRAGCAGSASATACNGAVVLVRFEPRVKLKSPSDSSYTVFPVSNAPLSRLVGWARHVPASRLLRRRCGWGFMLSVSRGCRVRTRVVIERRSGSSWNPLWVCSIRWAEGHQARKNVAFLKLRQLENIAIGSSTRWL